MNVFRRLTADVPGELLAAQIGARQAQAAAAVVPEMTATDNGDLFTILGFLAEHPGVPDHTTPGFPVLATAEGDPR